MTKRIIDKILPKDDMPFGVFAWLELHKAKYPKNTNPEAAIKGKTTNIISHLLSDCVSYICLLDKTNYEIVTIQYLLIWIEQSLSGHYL
jgi:hypothetical protein